MDVARSYDMGITAVMKSILIGEGIDVQEYIGSGHVSLAGADLSYYVKVASEDTERAQTILSGAGYEKYIIRPSA
jgi:hypothetical protein